MVGDWNQWSGADSHSDHFFLCQCCNMLGVLSWLQRCDRSCHCGCQSSPCPIFSTALQPALWHLAVLEQSIILAFAPRSPSSHQAFPVPGLPSGNQPWQVGKSPSTGGLNGKLVYKWRIFHCYALSWPMHRLPLPSGFAARKPHQVLSLEGLSAPVENRVYRHARPLLNYEPVVSVIFRFHNSSYSFTKQHLFRTEMSDGRGMYVTWEVLLARHPWANWYLACTGFSHRMGPWHQTLRSWMEPLAWDIELSSLCGNLSTPAEPGFSPSDCALSSSGFSQKNKTNKKNQKESQNPSMTTAL